MLCYHTHSGDHSQFERFRRVQVQGHKLLGQRRTVHQTGGGCQTRSTSSGNFMKILNLIGDNLLIIEFQFFLRGVNSDTLDVDVGATKNPGAPSETDIIGYRFEIVTADDFEATETWEKARQIDFPVEDGEKWMLKSWKKV